MFCISSRSPSGTLTNSAIAIQVLRSVLVHSPQIGPLSIGTRKSQTRSSKSHCLRGFSSPFGLLLTPALVRPIHSRKTRDGRCGASAAKPYSEVTEAADVKVSTGDAWEYKENHEMPRIGSQEGNERSPAVDARLRENYKSIVDYFGDNFPVSREKQAPFKMYGNKPKTRQPKIRRKPVSYPENHLVYGGKSARALMALQRALKNNSISHSKIFNLYRELPYPRIPHLRTGDIHLLLRRLSKVRQKDEQSMLQYFSIIDDVTSAGVPLLTAEWTTAMSFAGRWAHRVTELEAASAIQVWKEMEGNGGVRANHVGFNVLFDVAAKAGKFAMAEEILLEMEKRELPKNRYTYVGLIHYHGLKKDGEGVRRAYLEMIEAGEIIDTVTLNCLIASLITAGEPIAASHVYERLKQLHSRQTGHKLPHTWREEQDTAKLFTQAAALRTPRLLLKAHNALKFSPNLKTYIPLVAYHATESAEFDSIARLLTEMSFYSVPLHGIMFRLIFEGFARHGGLRYTSWNTTRLESVWEAFLQALDTPERSNNVFLRRSIVVWILRAFGKCAGKKRMLEVWEELERRWKPNEDELRDIHNVLEKQLILRLKVGKMSALYK
jgi:Pentatricopeptide repeat domain